MPTNLPTASLQNRCLLIAIISIACGGCLLSCNPHISAFDSIPCKKDGSPPVFDDVKVTLTNSVTGKVTKDTIIDRIPKMVRVFKPCRQFIYEATYRDSSGTLISREHIQITVTGNRWKYQPEMQDEIIIHYKVDTAKLLSIRSYYINKKLAEKSIVSTVENTGVIENERQLWMHPFRSNQYNFTDVAPFPEVKFPVEVGREWSSSLGIGAGWGDWDNTIVSNYYKVVGKECTDMKFARQLECWRIESFSESKFGRSTNEYLFHPDYGFVMVSYKNYRGQTLIIELEKLIDK